MRRFRESYTGGEPTPLATTVEMKATMAISGRHWNAPDISATSAVPVRGARTVPENRPAMPSTRYAGSCGSAENRFR